VPSSASFGRRTSVTVSVPSPANVGDGFGAVGGGDHHRGLDAGVAGGLAPGQLAGLEVRRLGARRRRRVPGLAHQRRRRHAADTAERANHPVGPRRQVAALARRPHDHHERGRLQHHLRRDLALVLELFYGHRHTAGGQGGGGAQGGGGVHRTTGGRSSLAQNTSSTAC